ncbi:hypothetical protein H696_03995 [Fonticula alba]|uniref:Uncharacterized protein n=1 Tax=Fonticula alba TaxID=691883 RepID=A0A058Z6N2_FONAL|nr:hypothetical protein H696_03995 [Fonticula alba]KCV69573.1 hypothetical protein H696_03995 [Fonticula alba]|eukprot:XP_009496138.1 hypothetical protein H696_03995 [Fonticula alba]
MSFQQHRYQHPYGGAGHGTSGGGAGGGPANRSVLSSQQLDTHARSLRKATDAALRGVGELSATHEGTPWNDFARHHTGIMNHLQSLAALVADPKTAATILAPRRIPAEMERLATIPEMLLRTRPVPEAEMAALEYAARERTRLGWSGSLEQARELARRDPSLTGQAEELEAAGRLEDFVEAASRASSSFGQLLAVLPPAGDTLSSAAAQATAQSLGALAAVPHHQADTIGSFLHVIHSGIDLPLVAPPEHLERGLARSVEDVRQWLGAPGDEQRAGALAPHVAVCQRQAGTVVGVPPGVVIGPPPSLPTIRPPGLAGLSSLPVGSSAAAKPTAPGPSGPAATVRRPAPKPAPPRTRPAGTAAGAGGSKKPAPVATKAAPGGGKSAAGTASAGGGAAARPAPKGKASTPAGDSASGAKKAPAVSRPKSSTEGASKTARPAAGGKATTSAGAKSAAGGAGASKKAAPAGSAGGGSGAKSAAKPTAAKPAPKRKAATPGAGEPAAKRANPGAGAGAAK